MTSTTDPAPTTRRGLRRVPLYVWALAVVGAVAGALLAEPGDFVGNTVPSTLTFLGAGAVLGLLVWGVVALVTRGR